MDRGSWWATVHGIGDPSPYYVITNVDRLKLYPLSL